MGVPEGKSATRQWSEEVLTQAMQLEEGDQLIFQMEDGRQLNAYRAQLCRARDRLADALGAEAMTVNISSKGALLIVYRSKSAPLRGTILKRDGSMVLAPPIRLKPTPIPRTTDQDPLDEEMLRRREELMKATDELEEDGSYDQ